MTAAAVDSGRQPAVVEATAGAGRGPLGLAWRRLRRDPVAWVSFTVIVLVVALAAGAPLVARLTGHGPDVQFRQTGLTADGLPVGPGARFWLGADDLGRDVLVRIAYGARISLLVGVLATVLAVAVGTLVGLLAGFFGGLVDTALGRLMDVVLSFPFLLFAIALVSIVGSSLTVSILVIAFFSWATVGRVVRAQALSIRQREYVEAARSLGAGELRIMFTEVLPNVVAPVIVYTTLLIPTAIVFEATLSFLGLGVVPPTPSWGNMLAESLQYYQVAWWFAFFPGLALLVTTVAFNLLGDAVRDALDPRSLSTGRS